MAKKETLHKRPDGLYEKVLRIDGKRVAFRSKDEKEVFLKIANYQKKVVDGATLKEISEQWFDNYEKENPYSVRSVKSAYESIKHTFEDSNIKDITSKDITVYLKSLRNMSLKTVKNYRGVFSSIMTYAIENGELAANPVAYAKTPTNLKKGKRDLPEQSQIDVVKKSVNLPFGFFALLLLYSGCRRGEALALQFKDFNLKGKSITISKSVAYTGNAPKIKVPKTQAGNREVILLDEIIKHIPKGKPSDFVFSNTAGKEPLTNTQATRLWKQYQNLTGVTITPHQLRHAYATILYEAGIDERMSMELLGHANIAITKEIYTHISSSKRSGTAQTLNNFITME